jgi:hypothetical protein
MRVKLCSRCPYTPRDLAGHYDPEGILHVCAKCDGRQEASTNHYPRKAYRRQQCAISLQRRSQALRDLRRKARPALTANRPLFKEVRPQDTQDGDRRWLRRLHAT